MHRCPQCGRPTDGQHSDGGDLDDLCDDCYFLEYLNGPVKVEKDITEQEAVCLDSNSVL